VNRGEAPSDAASLLARARRTWSEGNPRHALIETITALDVATAEFVRRNTEQRPTLKGPIKKFTELKLPEQLAILALSHLDISAEDLDLTIGAYYLRVGVVHKGKEPPDDLDRYLGAAHRLVAALLPGPPSRWPPPAFVSTSLRSPDEWDSDP
jgi:hypothetical protein